MLEASDELVLQAQSRFKAIKGLSIINSYFENYEPAEANKVSCILGNHVLEHLDDPVDVLRKSIEWLLPDGIAIFSVPNATSLHRRIGVQMGILKQVDCLSEQDLISGHKRVYDSLRLRTDIANSGYNIVSFGGFNLKLVSQGQMLDWPESLHEAIYHLSRECPEQLCSNLYAVCRRNQYTFPNIYFISLF